MGEARKLKLRQKVAQPTAAGYIQKTVVKVRKVLSALLLYSIVFQKSVALPLKKKSVSIVSTGTTNVLIPEADQKPSAKLEDNIDYIAKLLMVKLNQVKEIEREDVDAENRDNPFYCTEYVKEIFCYLRELEVSNKV